MKNKENNFLPRSLNYPNTTMYGAVKDAAERFPTAVAYEFMGKKTSYSKMMAHIDKAANAFWNNGIRQGDCVTICMPNTPQAIIALYALNKLGAVASMIHPLSSQKEITYYLNDSGSKMILTLDLFYEKVCNARSECNNKSCTIITARIQDELFPHLKVAYYFGKGKDYTQFPNKENSILWKDFVATGHESSSIKFAEYDKTRTSVLLYSGGTSGQPKGIMLSDYNFNVLGVQIREVVGIDFAAGLKFLSVMPIFHGFGLGIGIHTVLQNGIQSILVPTFTNESYAKLIVRKKPNFIAGVPTIYTDLLKSETLKNADLSCLYGVFSGGDTLPPKLKKDFDEFLKKHNCSVQIREGYGLTECVTASCLTPYDTYKENSIGLPLRDMVYKIVEPGTFNEVEKGTEGEIILTGPTLMTGYHNKPELTAEVLRKDENGVTWLFTGDSGKMDSDGYVYFLQRMKRMIITSGYNVYPSQIEAAIDSHPDVDYSCVIGVPDEKRMQRIRAYVVLKKGVEQSEAEKKKILEHCKLYVAAYAKPREIIFRDELPKTLVGKVAYHTLEEEVKKEINENI